MRATATIVILAMLSGCASTPRHDFDADRQRLKEASVNHAYGAALVVNGALMTIGGLVGAGFVASAGDSGGAVAAPIIGAAVGVVLAIVGSRLIAAGDNGFTPSTPSTPRNAGRDGPPKKKKRGAPTEEQPAEAPAEPEQPKQPTRKPLVPSTTTSTAS